MTEQEKKLTYLQQQKSEKLKPEDLIPNFLDGEMKKTAIDFVAYLRANKMNPIWSNIDTWQIKSKGKPLCRIRLLHPGWEKVLGNVKWGIQIHHTHINDYKETVINENLQNIIWDNVQFCKNCKSCAPGNNVTLIGKEFTNVCGGDTNTWVYGPDEAVITGIKRLLEMEKAAREEA